MASTLSRVSPRGFQDHWRFLARTGLRLPQPQIPSTPPQGELVGVIGRKKMAGLAGGNDEKSALRSGQIGDHPERGADGVRVGTRAAEKAEIDRYTVAAGRKRTDGQEASERPYGIQRMAQHQFVQIPPTASGSCRRLICL